MSKGYQTAVRIENVVKNIFKIFAPIVSNGFNKIESTIDSKLDSSKPSK